MNENTVAQNGHSEADAIEEVTGEEVDGQLDYCILQMWRDVLSNIEHSMAEKVSMAVASKIVASWPQVKFQECPTYHRLYHEYLLEARMLLQGAIDDNPGCLSHFGKDDLAENFEIYKTLVINWNIRLDELEQEWDAADDDSHIEFAAIVDARGFLFSRTGLAGHLESVGFYLDTDEIIAAIQTARGEK